MNNLKPELDVKVFGHMSDVGLDVMSDNLDVAREQVSKRLGKVVLRGIAICGEFIVLQLDDVHMFIEDRFNRGKGKNCNPAS